MIQWENDLNETCCCCYYYYYYYCYWGGDVAQLVERRTGTPLRQVRFTGAAKDFSDSVNFRCRLSDGVRKVPVCNRMH